MKKLVSTLVKIVVGLVAFVLIAVILLLVFFPSELVRKKAEEILTQQLQRQVTIEKAGFSIIKGVYVANISIKNRGDSPYKDDPFFNCKAFYLKYDLLELLKKRFTLEGLVIDSPHIYLKRYKNEKGNILLNVSDLLPAPTEKTDGKTALEPKKTQAAAKPATDSLPPAKVLPAISSSIIPIDFTVRELGLKNAKIELVDTALDNFKEIYSLHDVRFLITGIDLKKNSPMRVNTGFGFSISEFKGGAATEKAINLDVDITGIFKLFDDKTMLNPDGTLKLTLANGKFYGMQLYRELVSQGKDLTETAKKTQNDLLASIAKAKKAVADAKNNQQIAGKIGGMAGTAEKAVAIAEKLDKLDMAFISKAMDIGFLKENFEFDELTTTLRIRDEKVIASNIMMKGKEFSGQAGGFLGFNTVLDFSGKLIGDKKYNNNALTKAMADGQGNVILPFTIAGTAAKPKVSLAKIDFMPILRQEVEKQLGPDAGVIFGGTSAVKDLAKERLNAETDRLKKEAQEKIDAEKAELQKKAEEEKRQAEAEAKRKLEEEAKKKLQNSGIKVPKF
jgi:hypothetical protein